MKNILFRIILDNIILLGVASVYGYKCVTRKKLVEKFDQREDLILKIVIFILAIYLFVKEVLPPIMDIPNCINGNYLIIEGTAQHNDGGNRGRGDRRVDVLDEKTQQIVRVVFPYKPGIKAGDEVVVQYVPYSKYGVLLKINGEKIHDLHPTID